MTAQQPDINQNSTGFIPEIEQEVLGALLLSGSFVPALGVIKPEFFIEPVHRRIFEAMQIAHARYTSVNAAIVSQLVSAEEREGYKQGLGITFSAYLAQLASNTVFGIAGFRRSVPNLINQYARITLGEEAGRVSLASFDPGADPADIIKTATRVFDDISTSIKGTRRGKTRHSLREASDAALEQVSAAMASGQGVTGVTWGLADLNRATGGLHAGEMVVVGGRPGMAKTAFALSVGVKAAKAGHGVGFISLEMNAATLAKRAMTDIAFDKNIHVPYSDLITGRVGQRDFDSIATANWELENLPLWIEEQSGLSVADIAVTLDRMNETAEKNGRKIELVIIDYLQLVHASSRYQGNKVAEVSEVSFALRNMVRDRGMALMALSQLSRQVETREDKRPMLSDLRESGAIEQDADTVIFLYREAYYLANVRGKDADDELERLDRLDEVKHKLECIIAKQRNGAVRTVDLFIDVECSAVRNAARSSACLE